MPSNEPTLSEAEQLAFELTARTGAAHAAFVACDGEVFFATHGEPGPEPESALVKLVQGVYETRPGRALTILRNRIFLTHAPTPMCQGMLKVAARRLTAPIAARDHGLALGAPAFNEMHAAAHEEQGEGTPSLPFDPSDPPQSDADDSFMALALELAARVPSAAARRFDRDRPIAALLVSPDGRLLSWGVNAITRNRTFHAEVVAVQRWWRATRRPLPAGTRVYSTLKPCRMCAGMIWQSCQEPRSLQVFYHEFDPGPNARETVFNGPGLYVERSLL